MKFYADYCCAVGDRIRNKFISNAGLGITGAFEKIIFTIDWADGQMVDITRAEKLCEVLKAGINKDEKSECIKV